MNANRQLWRSQLCECAAVQIDVRLEPRRAAADDREGQWQPMLCRAHDRLGAATDADPGTKPPTFDRRIHELIRQPAAHAPRPCHRLLIEKLDEEIQLLLEQLVVLLERVTEERI